MQDVLSLIKNRLDKYRVKNTSNIYVAQLLILIKINLKLDFGGKFDQIFTYKMHFISFEGE